MDNPAGPVISQAMIDSRLKEHTEIASARLKGIFESVADDLDFTLTHLINEAYRKGLADGFAQRVYADVQSKEQA